MNVFFGGMTLLPLRGFIPALVLLCCGILQAQTTDLYDLGLPQLRIYSEKAGLPNPTVHGICLDPKGRVWVGTQGGAMGFDGREWKPISLPEPSSLSYVRGVHFTPDGSMWLGTGGSGLWRLRNGAWQEFSSMKGILSRQINALHVNTQPDGQWALWVATEDGLGLFSHEKWRFFTVKEGLPNNYVWKIRSGIKGRIWAATKGGLALFEDGKLRRSFGPADGLNREVNDVVEFEDAAGRPSLWVSCWGAGLAFLEGNRFRLESPAAGFGSRFPVVLCSTQSRDGERVLWAGTYNQGLWYRRGSGHWIGMDLKEGLPSSGVYALLPDLNGHPTIWVGFRGAGLGALNLGGWLTFDFRNGLTDTNVQALLERDGPQGPEMWFGFFNLGLARFRNGEWSYFSSTLNPGLPLHHVSSLAETRAFGEKILLVGTSKGLVQWDGVRLSRPPTIRFLDGFQVNALLESEEEGRPVLWAGTQAGLARWWNGEWTLEHSSNDRPLDGVNSLLEVKEPDASRTLWVGTRAGVGKLAAGRWTFYGAIEGLSHGAVRALQLCQSPSGERILFVGASGGGLSFLPIDQPGATWRSLNPESDPAFPRHTVLRIEQDRAGQIYANTNHGVVRITLPAQASLDPSKWNIHPFTLGDGLPNLLGTSGASILDRKGRLWMGTNMGVVALDPAKVLPPPPLPSLRVERITVMGKETPSDKGLDLTYNQHPVVIEFSFPLFHRPEDIRFQSQIRGLEPEPTAWTQQGRRELTALPAGRYVLRITAQDPWGRDSAPLEIPIRVRPAPWLHPLALLGYLLPLAAGVFLVHRFRLQGLRRHALELEGKVEAATSEIRQKQVCLTASNERLISQAEDLRQAKEEADTARKNQSAFLAGTSHDLRTPLNAILLYSQLLRDEAEEAGQTETVSDLKKIQGAGQHLLQLLNDLLDLAKVEAGKMTLFLEEVSIPDLVADIHDLAVPLAAQKGNTLKLEVNPALETVVADATRLRQILLNLLSNAAKFTEKGEITLSLRPVVVEGADWVIVEVQDTGLGMSPDQLGRLFQEFVQAEDSTTKKFGGTGLGLVLCQRLSALMGGDIQVASEPGKGSTFTVRLPSRSVNEAAPSAHAPLTSEFDRPLGRKVLIIDDDQAFREALARVFAQEDFEVLEAGSGEEGLKMARESHPSLITLDVVMPGIDGWTVLRTLKSEPELAGIPVILLTMADDRSQGLALGAAEYLPKPTDPRRFQEVLRRLAPSQGSLLLVEDDESQRQAMARILQSAGWQVEEAVHGLDALRILDGGLVPELILLDLKMPQMDGFEFMDVLHQRGLAQKIPVVVITSADLEAEARSRLAGGGVRQVLSKGAYPQEKLVEIVRDLALHMPATT